MTRKNPLHRSLVELVDGSFVDKRKQWHPALRVLRVVVVCVVAFLVLRFIVKHG